MDVARYLGHIVGRAHARQMDKEARRNWLANLRRTKTRSIDAPLWL